MTSASSMQEAGHSKLCSGTAQRAGVGREVGGGVQDVGTHVHQWLIYVKVWQKSPQYCEAIIVQLK